MTVWRKSCVRCAHTDKAPTATSTRGSAGIRGLDTIQAAVLIEKLKIFPDEIEARNRIASRYSAQLGKMQSHQGFRVWLRALQSVWAQYTIQVEDRARLQSDLKDEGIPRRRYIIPFPSGGSAPLRIFLRATTARQ